MQKVTSNTAKQNFGAVLKMVEDAPVEIVKYRTRTAVILSADAYDALQRIRQKYHHQNIERIIKNLENGGEIADAMLLELPHALRELTA